MFGSGYNGKIWCLSPNQVPFLTLLNQFKRITAPIDFRWLEDRPSWLTDTTDTLGSTSFTSFNAPPTTSDTVGTEFATSAGVLFSTNTAETNAAQKGQIWMVADADDINNYFLFYLKSYSSGWTIRLLTKPTFTPASGDPLTLTSIAYAEGSDFARYSYEGFEWKWGSTQNFKNSLFLSDESEQANDIVYNDPAWQKARCLEVLKKAIDRGVTDGTGRYSVTTDDPWGAPPTTNIVDSDGYPVRFTISLDQAIRRAAAVTGCDSRVKEIQGSSSTYITDVVKTAETIFRYVEGDVYGICGVGFLTWMNTLAMASPNLFNLNSSMTEFGLNIQTLVTPHGNIHVAVNKGMSGDTSRSNRCYVFDMNAVELVVSREIYEKDLPTTRSGVLTQWEGRYGLKVMTPEKHFLIQVK